MKEGTREQMALSEMALSSKRTTYGTYYNAVQVEEIVHEGRKTSIFFHYVNGGFRDCYEAGQMSAIGRCLCESGSKRCRGCTKRVKA